MLKEKMFEVVHMYGENGEVEGRFATIEEARKKAIDLKDRYFENDEFYIYELVWSEEEQDHMYQYENGAVSGLIEVITLIEEENNMLKEKIMNEIEKELMRKNKMWDEGERITLILTESEEKEFLNGVCDSEEFANWEIEKNEHEEIELTVSI